LNFINLLIFLAIGFFAGLLAGLILKGSGLGLACDVVAGIAGGLLGGILVALIGGADTSMFVHYAGAAIGATVVIMLAGPIKRRLL
jgi:uncharacterized membrane protein YeaQ/YmgE (transglycosylase-associated protein family)